MSPQREDGPVSPPGRPKGESRAHGAGSPVNATVPMFARRQAGSSLIEVLVSLTLVAVTMMGLLALQLRTMVQQKDSHDRRMAVVLAADFSERMAANYRGFQDAAFNGLASAPGSALGSAPGCANDSDCTEAEAAARDWWNLRRQVQARLPGGAVFARTQLLLAGGNADFVELIVGWSDPQREQGLSPTLTGADRFDPVCQLPAANLNDLSYRCFRVAVYP